MQRRNVILLIIVLIIILGIIFGFLYFQKPKGTLIPDTGGTNFFSNFNPFGTNKPKAPEKPADVSGYVPPITPISRDIKLRKVSSMPIAGYTDFKKERLKSVPEVTPPEVIAEITPPTSIPVDTKKKTTKIIPTAPLTELVSALRYVDRATGNIYQTFTDKIEERKFSVTTIPKIYEAFFGNKGDAVTMRYLKDDYKTIETFLGNLPKEIFGADTIGNNEVRGVFLPNNVTDISISPDTSKMFYLFNTGSGVVGVTSSMQGDKKTQVFDSLFTEWLSFWPNNNIITLTTKASNIVGGYMYTLNPIKKSFNKTLGPVNGLTTLTSPDGKLILYGDNNMSLNLYHTDSRNSDALSVNTLPEKCVWGKVSDTIYCLVPKSTLGGSYPDIWYKGEVSFSDEIWKIDLNTGNADILVDPITVEGGEEIDGIKLSLNEEEDYLFFVNKKDSFLWEFNLK